MDRDYEHAVRYLAESRVNSEFTNRGPEHASTVLSSLFRTAKEEIVIFSGCLNSDVADKPEFVKELKNFLKRGVFWLVLESMPKETECSAALKEVIALSDSPDTQIHIHVASQELLEKLTALFRDKRVHHFAVADSLAYRMETDPEQYTAICNFKDERISTMLRSVIVDYYSSVNN